MKRILRLDQYIECRVTMIVHFIQRTCGLTSYWLAQQFALMFALSSAIRTVDWLFPTFMDEDTGNFLAVMSTFVVLMYVRIAINCDQADKEFRSNPSAVPRNMLPFHGNAIRVLRTMSLLIVIIQLCLAYLIFRHRSFSWQGLLRDFDHSSLIWWTAFMFVVTVVPLPPGQSKVRELLRGKIIWQKPVSVE